MSLERKPLRLTAEDTPGAEPFENARRGVYCRYGIHSGRFPIAGLRLEEVRQLLSPIFNLDPKAVAVIDGQVVGENYVITDDVDLLNFIKPSSIMGG